MPIVGMPGPTPCSSAATVGAAPTLVFDVPAIERQKAVVTRYGETPAIRWQLVDRGGRPYDVTACDPHAGASIPGAPLGTVTLKLREMLSSADPVATFQGSVVDPANGIVEAQLPGLAGVQGPGIYWAEFSLSGADGNQLIGNVFTLYLEPSLFQISSGNDGPPSIMEVRLGLRDSSPAEARLIDAVTFDDAEIALAAVRPVQYFNEAQPPVEARFSTCNFPFRYHWVQGIAAQLFFMVAEYYRKNQLSYQAGGVAVDDFNKAQLYDQAGMDRWQEFKAWTTTQKAVISNAECWGSADSPYQYGYGFANWNQY